MMPGSVDAVKMFAAVHEKWGLRCPRDTASEARAAAAQASDRLASGPRSQKRVWRSMRRKGWRIVPVIVSTGAALKSSDGHFSCAPDHAVEVAYMLSNAEAVIDRDTFNRSEVGEVLLDYCGGRISIEEANRQLTEEFEPSSPEQEPANDD